MLSSETNSEVWNQH